MGFVRKTENSIITGGDMGPYSHYVLAAKLEQSIQPEDRKEYYWGAVAADIRYLANMRRSQTHLGQDRLKELFACYPHLRSFLLGYQVHVLIDEFEQDELMQMVSDSFPLNLLKKLRRKSIAPEQMILLVEVYFLQNVNVTEALSGSHNEVLSDLGITSEQTNIYQQALQAYFRLRSFDAALCAFQAIGMIQNSRFEKYRNAFKAMQKRKIMTSLLMLSIKNARLDSRVMEHVRSNMTASAN
jgi:hypothetical protein